ncbi:MAG: ligase-associated DNA damage response DEXH box helicase [Gemmatimonadales bacterium]|nr:MAG: ligase-associated DNA damage response DEXH box helicase [Gemmatimonadales bacterium]
MTSPPPDTPPTAALRDWFASRGWTPSAFQEELWGAWRAGESGLLMAPTGVGKTMAAWGGALVDGLARARPSGAEPPAEPLRYLWITPLRALARDTAAQLEAPLAPLGLPWTVEVRTGDTASSRKLRQRTLPPTALVTTPESLSILLSWPAAARRLRGLRGVVVDEWHELLGSKRGVQLELGLARLRLWNPGLRCWALSATLPNEEEALEALLGCGGPGPQGGPVRRGRIIRGPTRPPPEVTTLLPSPGETGRFPWAGHLGLRLLPGVVDRLASLDASRDGAAGDRATRGRASALLFTNTRSQAERWHEALARARPDWAERGRLALHHGSLDRRERARVEAGLRDRSLLCVVCTSTLELGVDLPAVELVIQVGSPRGVGRLLQRAGRSEHTPEGRSRLLGVPTHALEIVEFAAARRALEDLRLEPRRPLDQPLDVLAQHLVTVALGGGFRSEALLREVRSTRAFRNLSPTLWASVLDLVTRGGAALQAYPRYRRVVEEDGVFRVVDSDVERRHRWSIGTITDDAQLRVRFRRGATLGSVEESFLAQLRPGDTFLFAGRRLALVEIRDLTAWVRNAKGGPASPRTPRWMGGRLPLSTELAGAVLETFRSWEAAGPDAPGSPEFESVRSLLALQGTWSRIPGPDRLLVERTRSREGHHLFLYPFLGRLVHEGLGALVAHRISRATPRSLQLSANDYGIEFLSPDPFEGIPPWAELLAPGGLEADILEALNAAELSKRRFRGVARVAGLLVTGPGGRASARQLQASSGLLFDVLTRWDPDNLLLAQARTEALESELEFTQLKQGLERLSGLAEGGLVEVDTPRLTPLAFPLWAERLHARVSTERWIDRVTRMAATLERAAGSGRPPRSRRGAGSPP